MKRGRVAIVGGGFSGAALAAHLARRRGAPDIVLIERGPTFGAGIAYGTRDPAHLLNVRASNMSALSDAPDHFARWLSKRRGKPTDFAARMQYGEYVEDTLRRAPRLFGPNLKRVRGNVIACARDGDSWVLTFEKGDPITANTVVFAFGNAPPSVPAVWTNAGIELVAPWDAKALRNIPRGDVLVLGSGLTAVDVALSLARARRKGRIYALSRRGQLPRSHLKSATPPAPQATSLPLPLSDALFVLRKEAEAGAARGEPWQHVIDRLRARTPELWHRLPLASQQRFLRHVRPWWDAHRHRMAPEIAEQVASMQREGRLRLLAGDIVEAERKDDVIDVRYRHRGGLARHHLEVAGVVNCTGAAMNLATSPSALVQQLFADGVVRPHASGLGLDVDAEGRVIDRAGAAHPNLYALGPITQGVFWESTAVPEIRVRAAALATMLAPDR